MLDVTKRKSRMIPIFSLSNRRKVGFNEEMKERQTEAVSFQSKVWM